MRRMLGWCAAAALLALALGADGGAPGARARKRRVCAGCAPAGRVKRLRRPSCRMVRWPSIPRTADELDTLPGVGEVIAQRIIEEREENGPFYYPEDLMNVKGIGEKTLEKLLSHIRLP